ncbi:MAG: GNAT family N-acetyltransferase [Clostridia bacterium]|nr:GNAT family N-acetyltransferase [Clostridia bacterium]
MDAIRPATARDLPRIAEIEIFNYRLNFYPIFQNDWFYFDELQVPKLAEAYQKKLATLWVFDDGVVKGFFQAEDHQLRKLFVEPVLQGQSIGAKLLEYALTRQEVRFLWALEKNTRAIAFYSRHGFFPNGEKKYEDDTTEFLIKLERK